MLNLDPTRPPVTPRQAATLIVLRPGPEAPFEIFCVRRHAQSAFMGGVVVFPGGTLDEADREARLSSLANGIHPRSTHFADGEEHALALAVCACREALEEARILPAEGVIDIERLHAALAAGQSFADLLAETSLKLTTGSLVPFARWITPEAEQRRYDARFFMTVLPEGQQGRHDDHETVSSLWATPARLLDAFHAGDIFLAPPTLRAFELLAEARDLDAALALAERQTLDPICPRFVASDPPMLVLPGDPEHDIPEPRVAGPTRFTWRDGKFVSG